MRPFRVRLNAACLALPLVLAACGTTVPLQGAASSNGSTSGLGGAQDPSAAQGSTAQQVATGSSAPAPAGTASSSNPAAGDAGSREIAPRAGEAVKGTAPAVRAGAPILVGIPYLDQAQASTFTSAFGTGLESGDDKANFTLFINNLNKRGGILGRKVVPVFHRIDFSQPAAQYEAAACTDFTQDHRVSFVLSGSSPTLSKCLIDRGVGVVGDGSQMNTKDYDRMPFYVQSGSFSLDRLAALQAAEFTRMGLFKGTTPAKVGVLFYDTPTYRSAEQVLVAALKQRGIQVVAEQAFHYAASTQDLGQTQGEVQSAVLKFRSAGVTHVVGVELNAWLQGFFALGGDQQDYYPRYGWTSNQVPTNVAAVVPHKALVNSLLIGFYPTYDTDKLAEYPAASRACFRELAAGGIQVTSGNQRSSAAVACDSVRYLKAALTAGNGVTRVALVNGARALAHSFAPAVTYASLLSKGFGAGAAAVRSGRWSTESDSFVYTSSPYGVS